MNYLMTLKERQGYFGFRGMVQSYPDTMFVRRYLELFLKGDRYENPRENLTGGCCIRIPTVSRA